METNITLNTTLLLLFLLANLVIGLWSSRGIKTFDDYIQRGKNLSGGVLMATMVATLFDGSIITLDIVYKRGFVHFVEIFALSISALFLGFFVFPRLINFQKEVTLADLFNTIYGPYARIFVVLASTVFSFFIIVTQLTALGELACLFNLSPNTMMVAIGLIVTFYTYMGGIRSVVTTDVFQFFIIFFGIFAFFILSTYPDTLPSIIKGVQNKKKFLTFF